MLSKSITKQVLVTFLLIMYYKLFQDSRNYFFGSGSTGYHGIPGHGSNTSHNNIHDQYRQPQVLETYNWWICERKCNPIKSWVLEVWISHNKLEIFFKDGFWLNFHFLIQANINRRKLFSRFGLRFQPDTNKFIKSNYMTLCFSPRLK